MCYKNITEIAICEPEIQKILSCTWTIWGPLMKLLGDP